MKDGERLVWAAAFAQSVAGVNFDDQDAAMEQMWMAAAKAYGAVVVLRKTAAVCPISSVNHEGWAMLRDMAGLSH